MSILAETSLILLTSLYTGKPCTEVFSELALERMTKKNRLEERAYVEELSSHACMTSNPDLVWQIAMVETGFQFRIIRFNRGKGVVWRGAKAQRYLDTLKASRRATNLDIGVMQVNWYWHRSFFDNDPVAMMRPKNQIRYLVQKMGPLLSRICKDKWLGCYHNPANGPRAKKYNRSVKAARKVLKDSTLALIEDSLSSEDESRYLSQKQVLDFFDAARYQGHPRLSYRNIGSSSEKRLLATRDGHEGPSQDHFKKATFESSAQRFLQKILDESSHRKTL